MIEHAQDTLPRDAKGPLAPPPRLGGELQAVVDAVAAWPGVEVSMHWHFSDQSRVDGVDFYVGGEELGHLHLDGVIHLATTPSLQASLTAEGSAPASATRADGRRAASGAWGCRARPPCSGATTTG